MPCHVIPIMLTCLIKTYSVTEQKKIRKIKYPTCVNTTNLYIFSYSILMVVLFTLVSFFTNVFFCLVPNIHATIINNI